MRIIKKGYVLDLIENLAKYRRKKSSVVATELSSDGLETGREPIPKHFKHASNSSRLRTRAQ